MWEKMKVANSFISAPTFLFIASLLGQGAEGAELESLLPATNRLREAYKGAKRLNRNGFYPRFGSGRLRPIDAAVC